MKKRIIALLLILITVVCLCSGCKKGYEIKIGLVLEGDETAEFYNGFVEATKRIRLDFELKDGIVNIEKNVSADNLSQKLDKLLKDGCEIVVVVSDKEREKFETDVVSAAKKNKTVDFYMVGGQRAHIEELSNYRAVYAAVHDGKYLAGIAAGMKLKSLVQAGEITAQEAKVGYVATESGDEISCYNAFYLGVRAECPEAVMDVKYASDDYDSQYQAAQYLANSGCKVIAQNIETMAVGDACTKNGIFNIGHNVDTSENHPDSFIVATKLNWEEFLINVYSFRFMEMKMKDDWVGTFKTDTVQYTDVNLKTSDMDTVIRLDQMKAELLSGTRHVFDTSKFTVTIDKPENKYAKINEDGYLYACGAEIGYKFNIEVVKNGYYNECTERAFPYFGLIIDGITVVR